jgi:hypothetical protein
MKLQAGVEKLRYGHAVMNELRRKSKLQLTSISQSVSVFDVRAIMKRYNRHDVSSEFTRG